MNDKYTWRYTGRNELGLVNENGEILAYISTTSLSNTFWYKDRSFINEESAKNAVMRDLGLIQYAEPL